MVVKEIISMVSLVIKSFIFFLPAGIANMSPVLVQCINFMNVPIDFGYRYKGDYILGPNKTYRGLFFGTLCSVLTVYIELLIYPHFTQYALIDYTQVNVVLLGTLLGTGALVGDAVKSFFKRRVGKAPGSSWIPFDQLDWIIGAIISVSFIVKLDTYLIVTSLILFGLLHPTVNFLGYLMGLRTSRY